MAKSESPFMCEVFDRFHGEKRPVEMRPVDTQTAIHYLREFTGLTLELLAPKVGMIPSHLGALQRRNGYLKPETARMMARVAHSYYLPVLAKWFEAEAMAVIRRHKGKNAKADQSYYGLDRGLYGGGA